MKQFLYFMAGVTGRPAAAQLEAAGLSCVFPVGESLAFAPAEALGFHGVLFAPDSEGLRYNTASHDWQQLSKQAWIGVPKDARQRPGPEDLQRVASVVDGHAVKLGDGRTWYVPVVRFADGNTQLPRVLRRRADGTHGYDIRPEYVGIYTVCERLVSGCLNGQRETLSPDETMAFAATLLGINYRVGSAEISALGLIDSNTIRDLGRAALDLPTMERLVGEFKKKVLSETSAPGPA